MEEGVCKVFGCEGSEESWRVPPGAGADGDLGLLVEGLCAIWLGLGS